jgi:hypothetical protein
VLDRAVGQQLGDGDGVGPRHLDDLAVTQVEGTAGPIDGMPALRSCADEQLVADRSQASSTAPPLIHVCRDALVDPGRSDRGVGGTQDDLVDAEGAAGDLLREGDEPLADLGAGAVHGRERLRVGAELEAYPGGGVVLEPLGEHQVLDADRDARPRAGRRRVRR